MQSTSKSFASTSGSSHNNFRIPSQVPSEEDWEPDYKHTVCMICKEVTFNMVSTKEGEARDSLPANTMNDFNSTLERHRLRVGR